jgi:hypothetical protein
VSSFSSATKHKRMVAALAGILIIGVCIALIVRDRFGQGASEPGANKVAGSWSTGDEGFLAVATPCCSRASLWDSLDTVSPDGQRARPAVPAEAAGWLNEWPYHSRGDRDGSGVAELRVALRGRTVKCQGAQRFGTIPKQDEDVLRTLRGRRECEYTKWQAWTGGTSIGQPRERHVVWVDEDGRFQGRVEYKSPDELDSTAP